MGWGCNRHEVDAESDNWEAKIKSLLPNGASHGEPFDFGRDGQVCPFCFDELERISRIYIKALSEIVINPDGARMIAVQAFEEAIKIEQHPMDTDPGPQPEEKCS